jgi:NAD(P)-dependent dehydrogenase (short-subunit alcohol dehydrogenase family)
MHELSGKVAVVTGAASGIGKALSERFAAERMHLALADIEAEPLFAVADALRDGGAEVEASVLDVRDASALVELASKCASRFGGVHVLCNNAGVATGGPMWDVTPEDWDWVVGVNLIGVINGIRAFVPGMVAAGEPAHVVNTASIAGLVCPALMGPYNVTKHAVVALSETLRADLAVVEAKVGVSVLCPGWVQTRIHESDRNKPGFEEGQQDDDAELGPLRDLVRGLIESGIGAQDAADHVLEAIRADRFWVRTHEEMEPNIAARCAAIVAGEAPPLMVPTDIK